MRKVVFVVLVCVFGPLGQVVAQRQVIGITVGVNAGVNLASVDVKAPSSCVRPQFKTGFNVGITALARIVQFGLQAEVVFMRQNPSVEFVEATLATVRDHINIPILLKYYPLKKGPSIQFGPQFGFLVGAEGDRFTLFPTANATVRRDVGDDFKSVDVGLAMGLGWDFLFGLSVDVRYNMGLTVLNKGKDPQTGGETKSQVVQFSVGYKLFELGKNKKRDK